MLTKNDLLKCGKDEGKRIAFINQAINDYKQSDDYKTAETAMKYYLKENPDIEAVEKIIYDMKGVAHKDMISPNAKLRCCYFPNILNEACAHLLTNGIGFENESNKELLGEEIDDILKDIDLDAMICGVSYGYYYVPDSPGEKPQILHLKFLNTLPILDDYTGKAYAYIYFTQLATDKPLCVTFFEPDGATEYVQEPDEPMKMKTKKAKYRLNTLESEAEGVYFISSEETTGIPIYPLYNVSKKSSIVGVREDLAALDLMASQLVNNVSQAELVYWVLKNYGGMDDIADANFIVNLIKSHVLHVDADGSAEPHQITVPFEANKEAYVRIKQIIYDNLCGVNHETLDAGNLTATAIAAAYSKQRNYSAMQESNVFNFLRGMLKIAGVTEREKFTVEYYETINTTEAIQNSVASAQWLGDTETTKRLAILNGSGERIDEIMREKAAEGNMVYNNGEGLSGPADMFMRLIAALDEDLGRDKTVDLLKEWKNSLS